MVQVTLFQNNQVIPIVITFNHQYQFVSDLDTASKCSEHVAMILDGDSTVKTLDISLPHPEEKAVCPLEIYLKAGIIHIPHFEEMFIELFVNADFLGCKEILSFLKKKLKE